MELRSRGFLFGALVGIICGFGLSASAANLPKMAKKAAAETPKKANADDLEFSENLDESVPPQGNAFKKEAIHTEELNADDLNLDSQLDTMLEFDVPTHSQFFSLPAEGEDDVRVGLRTNSSSYLVSGSDFESLKGTESSQDIDFEYMKHFSGKVIVKGGVGFESSALEVSSNNYKSQGLTDPFAGVYSFVQLNDWNMLYGGRFSVSPSTATVAVDSNAQGNRFSGRTDFTPMLGFETMRGRSVMGVQAKADVYSERDVKYNGGLIPQYRTQSSNNSTYHLDGFYELKVSYPLDLGLALGFGSYNQDLAPFHYYESQYTAQLYGRYQFADSTILQVFAKGMFGAAENNQDTTTSLGVNLQQTL